MGKLSDLLNDCQKEHKTLTVFISSKQQPKLIIDALASLSPQEIIICLSNMPVDKVEKQFYQDNLTQFFKSSFASLINQKSRDRYGDVDIKKVIDLLPKELQTRLSEPVNDLIARYKKDAEALQLIYKKFDSLMNEKDKSLLVKKEIVDAVNIYRKKPIDNSSESESKSLAQEIVRLIQSFQDEQIKLALAKEVINEVINKFTPYRRNIITHIIHSFKDEQAKFVLAETAIDKMIETRNAYEICYVISCLSRENQTKFIQKAKDSIEKLKDHPILVAEIIESFSIENQAKFVELAEGLITVAANTRIDGSFSIIRGFKDKQIRYNLTNNLIERLHEANSLSEFAAQEVGRHLYYSITAKNQAEFIEIAQKSILKLKKHPGEVCKIIKIFNDVNQAQFVDLVKGMLTDSTIDASRQLIGAFYNGYLKLELAEHKIHSLIESNAGYRDIKAIMSVIPDADQIQLVDKIKSPFIVDIAKDKIIDMYRDEVGLATTIKSISTEGLSNILTALVNDASGYITDSEKKWEIITKMIDSIPRDKQTQVVVGTIESINNSSRRERLINLLPENAQTLVRQDLAPTAWEKLHNTIASMRGTGPEVPYPRKDNQLPNNQNMGSRGRK